MTVNSSTVTKHIKAKRNGLGDPVILNYVGITVSLPPSWFE